MSAVACDTELSADRSSACSAVALQRARALQSTWERLWCELPARRETAAKEVTMGKAERRKRRMNRDFFQSAGWEESFSYCSPCHTSSESKSRSLFHASFMRSQLLGAQFCCTAFPEEWIWDGGIVLL